MMTSSNGSIFYVTGPLCGEFTGHRWIPLTKPVTRSFDVFFDLRLNKPLSKQSWSWWFKTPSRSLWRQCNGPGCLHLQTIRNYGIDYQEWMSPCLLTGTILNTTQCWDMIKHANIFSYFLKINSKWLWWIKYCPLYRHYDSPLTWLWQNGQSKQESIHSVIITITLLQGERDLDCSVNYVEAFVR